MGGRSDFEIRLNIALEGIRDSIAFDKAVSGEDGFVETISFDLVDFGAAAVSEEIISPAGYRGRVISTSIYDITETFAVDGLDAIINVGTTSADVPASDVDYYWTGETVTDALAANAGQHMDGTFNRYIPESTAFVVHKPLATDSGTVAGIAKVNVTIAWMALES